MLSQTLILLTASFIPFAAAIPVITAPSLTEIVEDPGFLTSGPTSVRNAYNKYGASLPEHIAAAAIVKRSKINGTVAADPTEYDATYNVQVGIGTPYTYYEMAIDTGGTSFTVYANKYGTSGTVTETVDIGGVVVTKQIVTLNDDPTGDSNVVGLDYAGTNLYTNAVAQGAVAPVFTADLNKGAPGRYNFGYIDPAEYKGSITYATVKTTNGFWEFVSNGYAVGSAIFVTRAIDAVVDTGTTLLFLPQAVCTAYYKQVPGTAYDKAEGGYTFPCSSTMPNLTLGVGAYRAVVPGSYLIYAPVDTGSATCFVGLQPDTGIGFSILGLVFIKSQFVVFKGTTSPSIGFAVKS